VSAHYLIPERLDASYPSDEPLKVYQLVGEQQRAWHAGESRWEGKTSLNDQSIGIELVNRSQCYAADDGFCLTPDFDPAQMELLATLLKDILRRHPEITPTRVLGHSDIVPERKQDPGARFPWQWLARQGVGAWYDDQTVLKYWQQLPEQPAIRMVQHGLKQYGYGIEITGEHDRQTQLYLQAFQRHFVPDQVHGNADRKTVAILMALLEKYFPQTLKSAEFTLPLPKP
jgi:N-acetylmuramoyl-L-alanine amidase